MDVSGSVVLVSGGASGLGEATLRALVGKGAKGVILDMNVEKGEAIAKELDGVEFVKADVSDAEQVQAGVDKAVSMGKLVAGISCAGIGWGARLVGKDGSPHDLGIFQKVIGVNLVGTFNVMRLSAAAMGKNAPDADNHRGVLINTASIAAMDGQIGQCAYSASKGGIVGMTLPVARDLAKLGVRVNTICPGTMDTPLLAGLPEPARQGLAAAIPFPSRLGQPEEFGALAAHIVENNYINGEVFRLDGALRMAPK